MMPDDDDDDDENHRIEGNFEWVTKDVHGLMKTFLRPDILFEDPDHSRNVVDIGCGTSTLPSLLAKSYTNVVGIDVNPKIVKEMNMRYEKVKNLRFICMDIYESRCDETYDLVIDKSTLDYLMSADPLVYLEKIRSNLLSKRKCGRYVTISFYKPSFMEDLLEASGFELVRTTTLGDEQYVYISKRSETREPNEEKQKRVLSEIFIRNDRSMLDDKVRMCRIREKMNSSSCSLLETYNIIFSDTEREEYKYEDFLRDTRIYFQKKKAESGPYHFMNADMALDFLRTMQ